MFSGQFDFHMWFVLAATAVAAVSYVRERLPIEVTSVLLLMALLVFGQIFPVHDANGRNMMDSAALLSGFANPALVAVLALLVMGQGVMQTEALRPITQALTASSKKWAWLSVVAILFFVMSLSAFMNNTPLVVLAIPVLQALAAANGMPESRVMMPLSYGAILGGMMTLVGSSTNMLVSSALLELGYKPLQFFDFTVPGAILAVVGFVYVIFVMPRLLPDRGSLTSQLVGDEKEFIAELDVASDSKLVGAECVNGVFPIMPDLKVRLIQRMGHLILPPFEGYVIEPGDILIVGATRDALGDLLSKYPGYLLSKEMEQAITRDRTGSSEALAIEGEEKKGPVVDLDERAMQTRALAEVMITPTSRMIDMSLEQVNFPLQFGAIVLGVQRRARVVRRRLGRVRLEPGDVLLVAGSRASIESMRGNPDLIVLSGSKKDLPVPKKAPLAGGIMVGVIGFAALDILSIPVAAITGAVLMIATGCLNIRQAIRAIDRKIFLLVGSMLALGTALQVTNGARFIAEQLLGLPFLDAPLAVVAVLFLIIAILTNILSNNACAILFTPIAVNMAVNLGTDPFVFAVTVVMAANCSFASPIGYKTNLLVMGPGHYRFVDFMKAGVPLLFIIWIAYILIARFYYGL